MFSGFRNGQHDVAGVGARDFRHVSFPPQFSPGERRRSGLNVLMKENLGRRVGREDEQWRLALRSQERLDLIYLRIAYLTFRARSWAQNSRGNSQHTKLMR